MGKIGIAPHHQTLNLYYSSKYINFVIKLLYKHITSKSFFPSYRINGEKEDKRGGMEHKKILSIPFTGIFCFACCKFHGNLNKFFIVYSINKNVYEQKPFLKTTEKNKTLFFIVLLIVTFSIL
jgi:hypothetical protein